MALIQVRASDRTDTTDLRWRDVDVLAIQEGNRAGLVDPPVLDRAPEERAKMEEHCPPPEDIGDAMVFATDIELYPSSDGKPMAENKVHYRWITTIEGNLESLFAEEPMVFVAADMNWHPVPRSHPPKEGEYVAPDVMVVFGVPKGDDARRNSYIQHLENNIPPQVVFEIHSPSNKAEQRKAKFRFYQQHGVEEYYYYNPSKDELMVWLREGRTLEKVNLGDSWVSPRLQIRFDLSGETMCLYYPNGELFKSFAEIHAEKERAEVERDRERMQKERERMAKERERAEKERAEVERDRERMQKERERMAKERERAEKERVEVERDRERMQKERERDRADRLAAKLRELGLDPDKI